MLPGTPAAPAASPRTTRSSRGASIRSLAIVALGVPAIFATVALPAYAYTPVAEDGSIGTAALSELREENAQAVEIADVQLAVDARDGYDYVSAAALRREAQRAALAAYSGPTVRELLANPPYPSFSLDQVVQVALQYQGVPYVYGGATPAGFDCSGFVMYVYAQFGVGLPHSSRAQGAGGVAISRADARPGDIVVMDGGGHSGIYLGDNLMVHSPRPGKVVEIRPIWDPNAWFVRYGI